MSVTHTPLWVQHLFPRMQWRQPHSAGAVYLTFDDGPTPGITPWVLEVLRAYGAKATFFVVGHRVAKYPELARQIVAEGHQLGNHTYHHPNGWKTGPRQYLMELARTRRIIQRVTGQQAQLFRPPYGKLNIPAKWAIQRQYRIVMWDVLARDFDPRYSASDCLDAVMRHTRAGSIIVLHDSVKCAVKLRALLPELLDYLQAQNLKPIALT
ncbi:MAG: polysaccharide deacetylase family protein [Bacteroidetes bacterium]|jgi:peptidoglycan/xylan/chitin deacetylase (PgdA/CDA1 family)|nr:polysaccharide deacetylase family protein [Bacteroidota bacterium]